MSGGDDPVPGGNRTVFRPSPLSGLGQTPPPPPVSPPPPPPPAAADAAPAPPQAAPPPAPTVERAPVAPSQPRLSDEGIPVPAAPRETRAPLATEAGPLLALAASVRSGRARIAMADFHRAARDSIAAYDRAITPLYPDETRRAGRALLAATVDDIAGNLPNLEGGEQWSGAPLSEEYGGGEYGEEQLWKLLDKALEKPEDNGDLIELAHACLAAGFAGRHRGTPEGRAALNDWSTRLYGGLDHIKALSQRYVSPQWVGYDAPLGKVGLFNIIALVVAGALVLILGVYALTRVMLAGGDAETAALDARPQDVATATERALS